MVGCERPEHMVSWEVRMTYVVHSRELPVVVWDLEESVLASSVVQEKNIICIFKF